MIRITKGDMFATHYDIRVNPVNCVGVMGAGLALAFRRRYPEMFEHYQWACQTQQLAPGKIQTWSNSNECVVNFPTKRHWRDESTVGIIADGLDALATYLWKFRPITVALPALGCGLGQLSWPEVRVLIFHKLAGLPHDISVFEPHSQRL